MEAIPNDGGRVPAPLRLTLAQARRHYPARLMDPRPASGMPASAGPLAPLEALSVLQSARTSTPDPRLDALLQAFRRQWEAIARHRYRNLGSDLDDAVQEALLKLTDPRRLAGLRDPARIEAWGRSLFVRTVLDYLKFERSHVAGRVETTDRADAETASLIEAFATPHLGPEEEAAERQRIAIILRTIGQIEVGRLKFFEQLPDKEIAARCHLTRDGVAGQLKRLRKQVRAVLDAAERARSS